jgi:6-phosphofructokinase 1
MDEGGNRKHVFISYCFDDESFVSRVCYYLSSQPGLDLYFYSEENRAGEFPQKLSRELETSDSCILFLGSRVGKWQKIEANLAVEFDLERVVMYGEDQGLAAEEQGKVACFTAGLDRVLLGESWKAPKDCTLDQLAHECAVEVVKRLDGVEWQDPLGLPVGYQFKYEKDIIQEYVDGRGELSAERLRGGCPGEWPGIRCIEAPRRSRRSNLANARDLQHKVGRYRPEEARIVVDARSEYLWDHSANGGETDRSGFHAGSLSFPEAGPRQFRAYPRGDRDGLEVAIVVSGGIAPGINAVIAAIVERHRVYAMHDRYDLTVHGCVGGVRSLLQGGNPFREMYCWNAQEREGKYGEGLDGDMLRGCALDGGSILATSRADELLSPVERPERVAKIVSKLRDREIDIVYVIGGDGSMKAARAISGHVRNENRPLAVVGIPKTTDNDILWVWQALGFVSAVEEGRKAILQLHTEAKSNPRLGVVQLFGSDSGFVVSHAALASAACDLALIPEVPFSMEEVCKHIMGKLKARYRKTRGVITRPYGIVVMAETAVPMDVAEYVRLSQSPAAVPPDVEQCIGFTPEERDAIQGFLDNDRRVAGGTPDDLRKASLKVVSGVLQYKIRQQQPNTDYWSRYRVFTNEPRHLLRSINPSVHDVIFGQRLGMLAVDNAVAGYTNFMVSQWLTEYVLVPLELAVLGRKRVPPTGIFWKSVLAATGQPASLE